MLPLYQAERQVSWLRDLQSPPPSQAVAQWRSRTDFSPRHSDEIARDLHPFPFYPLPLCRAQCKGTVRFSFNCNSIIAKAMQVRKHFLRVSERSFWGARPRL